MARIKMAYIGGGSTRGAGTMASFIHQGENFDGSEVVLIDLDPERLDLIKRLAERMVEARGLDLTIAGDDQPPRRPQRLRRDPLELPARRLRRARARREDPAQARHHRPGDAGPRRLLHGAARDPRDAGHPRRRRGRLPGRADLQLHEPGQRARAGRDVALGRAVRLAVRGADLLRRPDRQGRRPRPRRARYRHGRPQPRLLERQARVQGRRRDAARGRGLGAAQGRSGAHRRPPPPAAHRGRDGRDPGGLLPVLLLPGRGARRAAGQADDTRRGHPRLVDRLLGALRRAGRARRSPARPQVLARRHPRARARDRRDGRGLQQEGRDPHGQRPEHRRDAAGVRRDARRRAARPLWRARRLDPAAAGARAAPRSTCAASCTSSGSTRRWRPTRPGRARAATPSTRSPRTR